jgi:hypothetical protein
MSASAKTNLVLDLTIFSAFLVISNPRFTGNTLHEWLGISFAAALVTHLLFHWDWIVKIGGEFFKKLFHQSRLNFVVDTLFLVAMTGAMLSGLMISKNILATFGIQLGQVAGSWKMIHSFSADASLVLLAIHTALHWGWVTANFTRYIATPVRGLFQNPTHAPRALAVQPVRIEKSK